MFNITLTVTLTLEGPILTKSTSMGGYGLDAVMAKNHNGEYYLPGTLVKGRLLQAWQELHDVVGSDYKTLLDVDKQLDDFANLWLGKKSGSRKDRGAVDSYRTKIHFTDFIYAPEAKAGSTLHRIHIDKDRGSVIKGALLVMEAPFAVGEEVAFKGSISFTTINNAEAAAVKKCVDIGLKWIPNFGSEKTVGFGRLVRVSIDEKSFQIVDAHSDALGKEFLYIIINPEAPFCFAKRQVSDNLFESEDIISGGAIKGALASTWAGLLGKSGHIEITNGFDNNRKELSEHFHEIRITHAFPMPVERNERPVVAPLSLAKVKKNEEEKEIKANYDVAFEKEARLINGFPDNAPAFAVDWKDSTDIEKIFGWDDKPKRELRVRTAMDRERRKSKDKELFAYEMVIPTGFKWVSRIDLSRITDATIRAKVEAQLRQLLSLGLIGMSKNKISAKVEPADTHIENKIKSVCEPINRNGQKYWVITLQTPAILCNPTELNEISTSEDLFNNYKKVWDKLSSSTLELSHFFATQSLAGGYYLHKRFQDGKPYRPYLLTNAGSVFVFTEKRDAKGVIEKWLKNGLDFPQWAKKEYGKDGKEDGECWQNCPYIPENGYGEIAVNIHQSYSNNAEGEVKINVL
ncbi:MAG: hypothetical protein HZB80_07840 [Deltaproteobacteria bacterium]|nr:hypothetical protein [Deltaproteobacteria bacterium]